MKFKVGDRIKIIRTISEYYQKDVGTVTTIKSTNGSEEYPYILKDTKGLWQDSELQLIKDTMINSLDDLEVGKVYVDRGGEEVQVDFIDEGRKQAVVHMHGDTYQGWNILEIIKHEWKLKTEPKEMTMEELNEELGYEVKIVE